MTGILHKKKTGFVVKYWKFDPEYLDSTGNVKPIAAELAVSHASLLDPKLSTYWVDGRAIEFEITIANWDEDNSKCLRVATIIHDEDEVWDQIAEELIDRDITGSFATLQWLKTHYNPPIKK